MYRTQLKCGWYTVASASVLKGPDKLLWEKAHGEEIVRLIESQTGRFIHRREMPADRTAAYYNPQLKIKVKAEGKQYRVRGTIGGDKVHYPGVTAAYTAYLETIRAMLNAIVSEDAEFGTADIKDFYLGTPLDRKEYMRIPLKHIHSTSKRGTTLRAWYITVGYSWKSAKAYTACHRLANLHKINFWHT